MYVNEEGNDAQIVKLLVEVAVPLDVVTVIVPVVAPVGTVTVRLVAVAEDTVAVVPLNFTLLDDAVVEKFVPVIVTVFPASPAVGVKLVIVGKDPTKAAKSKPKVLLSFLSFSSPSCLQLPVIVNERPKVTTKQNFLAKIKKFDELTFFSGGGVHLFSYIHICTKHPQ